MMDTPVGLLLVHGIGRQGRGDTLDGFLSGMRLAYRDRLVIERHGADYAVLNGVGRTVHVFEVYWADLLQGSHVQGSFDRDRIRETVWFPLLNLANQSSQPSRAVRLAATADAFGMAILGVLVAGGLWGAKFIFAAFTGVAEAARESARGIRPRTGTRRTTWLDRALDETVADVFNYVHGLTDTFPRDDKNNRTIAAKVSEIGPRFIAAARRAQQAGCGELQVLAHSLGTVVAFRGMCARESDGTRISDERTLPLSRFYTFGSPIEKFRAFWWRVLDGSTGGPQIAEGPAIVAAPLATMRWDNFFSPIDLVSSAITPFAGWPAAINHRAPGLGGLVGAHVAYNGNPGFLAFVGEGLTGHRPRITVPWMKRAARSARALAESLLAPALLLAVSLLGFVVMVGFAWVTGCIVSRPLAWLGFPTLALIVNLYVPASILFVMTIGEMIVGRSDARNLHTKYWTRT